MATNGVEAANAVAHSATAATSARTMLLPVRRTVRGEHLVVPQRTKVPGGAVRDRTEAQVLCLACGGAATEASRSRGSVRSDQQRERSLETRGADADEDGFVGVAVADDGRAEERPVDAAPGADVVPTPDPRRLPG